MTIMATYESEDPARSAPACGNGRRCIVSGDVLPRESMIRFVVGPDNSVVPDILGKLPGRGLWVRANRGSLATAVAKGRFAYAARQRVIAPEDIADRVGVLLTKRCIDLIALARRAGEAVAGYEKVGAWLRERHVALLVEAADGADGGRNKILSRAAGVPVVDCLVAAELGQAFGRERAVHAAIAAGALADRLRMEASRLGGFRPTDGEWGIV